MAEGQFGCQAGDGRALEGKKQHGSVFGNCSEEEKQFC